MPGLPHAGVFRRRRAALLGTLALLWTLVVAPGVAVAGRLPIAPAALAAPASRATIADVELGPAYWQGGANATATVVITVSNPGAAAGEIHGTYTLPAGVRRVGVTGAGGCGHQPPQGFRCAFAAGSPGGALNVKVAVDPEAWRQAPLAGTLTVSSGGVVTSDGYTLILPPGPPSAEIMTAVENVTLGATTPAPPEFATMTVRVANSLGADASGMLDIVTPAGLELVYFPVTCVGHRQLAANRNRCDLGTVRTGGETLLMFKLRVDPSVRAEAPLVGVVYGILAPVGRDVLTNQATYRVVMGTAGSGAGSVAPTPSAPATSRAPGPGTRVAVERDDNVFGKPLNPIWIVGSVIGLVTLVGLVMVLSLRRRMRSDI